jgi:tripartite motif-containing protein 71
MGDGASGEMLSGAGTCGEGNPAPTDTDGDGVYEDLNGNGRTDFADVVLYFNHMDWIREHQPVRCFDYNANGNIDFADLILLFHEI